MYFYVYNLQGDVTHIMKGDKTIVGTYQYDAWGKITNLNSLTSIAQINPFRYRGYYYDSESNLYYLNSRYYNPEWGRFINADDTDILTVSPTALTDKNLFSYCDSNPITRYDEDGDCWHLVVGGLVGATVSTVTEIITETLAGKNLDPVQILISAGSGALSGVLSASGAGLAAKVITDAFISAGTNAVEQAYSLSKGESDKWDWRGFIKDTAVGALFSLAGGKGASHGSVQSIKYSNKQVTVRIFKKHDNVKKALKYYSKSANTYKGDFIIETIVKPSFTDVISFLYSIVDAFGRGRK